MLTVVTCDTDNDRGLITLASDLADGGLAITELKSANARQMAIMAAARGGLPDPRINGNVATFPVDSAGNPIERPMEQKVAGYRGEVPVTRRMV